MKTNYHTKKVITSLSLFAVFSGLLALPVLSFNMIKPPVKNDNVLGVSDTTSSFIEGKIKYTEQRKRMVKFELVLEPEEYLSRKIDKASGSTEIVLTKGSEDVYATNKNGEIELINLSENSVVVVGYLF